MDEVQVDAGTPVRALARPSTNSKASSPSPGTPKRLALPSVPVGTSDPAAPVGAQDEVKDIVMAGTGNVVDPPGAVAPEDRACDPSGALAFQGSSMSSSAAAARAEVKVRVQSSPTLERHVERLEAHIVVLERRATELKTALDLKMQENVQNFQAALASKDANVFIGLEGGRRIHEYREAGMELQQYLQESRRETNEAVFAVAARDRHAQEPAEAFAASRSSESEMLSHAQSQIAQLHDHYRRHAHDAANKWSEEFQSLADAHAEMHRQAQGAVEACALAEASASALRAEAVEHRTAREELRSANASYRQQHAEYYAYLEVIVEQLNKTVADKEELLKQVRAQLAEAKKKSDADIEQLIHDVAEIGLERDGAFQRSRQLQERSDTLNTINLDQEVSLRANEKVIKRFGQAAERFSGADRRAQPQQRRGRGAQRCFWRERFHCDAPSAYASFGKTFTWRRRPSSRYVVS